jgi:two-component system sensor histidine kinase YesM
MSSIRSKLVTFTLLLGLIVYSSTAAVSYYLSLQKVGEEKAKQLAGIQEQVSLNIATVFEQAEKIALLLSENNDLLNEVTGRGADALEEWSRVESIETNLFRMNLTFTSIIESIQLSEKSGNVYVSANPYFLTSDEWRALNYFRLPQFYEAMAGRSEAWLPPPVFPSSGTAGRLSDQDVVFKDRFVYIKHLTNNIAVTITVNYRSMQSLIAGDSVFRYELQPVLPSNPPAKGEGTARFGLAVVASSEDSEGTRMTANNRQALLITVLALMLSTFAAALLFVRGLMQPIAEIKRQIEDVKKFDTVSAVLNYRAGRIRPLSFRVKIFVFLAVVYVAGASVLFTINYAYASRLIKHNLEQYYTEYVVQSGKWMEATLRSSEQVLNTVVSDSKLQHFFTAAGSTDEMRNEFKKFFSYRHVLSKNINYINLYDSRGELLFSTVNSFLNEGSIQTRNVYPSLQQTSGETIYVNENKDPFGDHVITAAKKIYDSGSSPRIIGYYMFAVNERELEIMNNSFGLSSLDFLVTESNGTVIYSKNKELVGKPWPNYWTVTGGASAITEQKIDGRNTVVMHEEMNKTNWSFISVIDSAETFRGAKDVLLVNGFALLAVLLTLFVLIYFMSRRIARPMLELNRHIRVVMDNKFEKTTVPVFAEKDEIGELAAHIRAMIHKIQEQMHYIYDVEVRNREIQLDYKKAELSSLLQQISPHFLYNTLETIRWMSMEMTNGENKVTRIIRALSVYLRSGVHAGTRMVTVKEELAHVRAYLYIQQIRLGGKLQVKWAVEDGLEQVPIVRFVLQPIVENALMHGIDGKETQAYLLIRIVKKAGKLIIGVTDNGAGIEPERLEAIHANLKDDSAGESVGLRNISRRLSLLYGEEAYLRIESVIGRWTRVSLALPLKRNEENGQMEQTAASHE